MHYHRPVEEFLQTTWCSRQSPDPDYVIGHGHYGSFWNIFSSSTCGRYAHSQCISYASTDHSCHPIALMIDLVQGSASRHSRRRLILGLPSHLRPRRRLRAPPLRSASFYDW